MSDFDIDLTQAERDAIIARRLTLATRADGVSYTTAHLDELRKLTLDAISLLIDTVQFTADEREYSRALNVDGYPNAPEYRHEFLMSTDPTYWAAWAYEHTEGQLIDYKAQADADPNMYRRVEIGRINHPYRESDPDIVDRSLLRNNFRLIREGETPPAPITGRYAPKITLVTPSIVNQSSLPDLTLTS